MATFALQQVSSKFARENAARTLEKPIGLKFVQKFLSPKLYAALESACPDGKVFIWGAKPEREHQMVKMPPRNCLVLFRRGKIVYKRGVIIETTTNHTLAENLWGFDVDGQTWSLVYFMRTVSEVKLPAEKANVLLGRSPKDNWLGLVAVPIKETEKVINFFKSQLDG